MDLVPLVENGTAGPLALVAVALVLGALHGLEPGHSKAMMGAFIIAVGGTVGQAVLLGLSAALSHTAIVWILALLALRYGDALAVDRLEPWFVLLSGVVILAIAMRLAWQLRRRRPAGHHHHHDDNHDHDHHGHRHVPQAALTGDGHDAAHARAIAARFSGGPVTTAQVVLFGLTGGLIPCAAAVTILILCLHLQKFWLGVALVGGFSAGLAAILVGFGVAVAWGRTVLAQRGAGRFQSVLAAAPRVSAVLVAAIGLAMIVAGLRGLV